MKRRLGIAWLALPVPIYVALRLWVFVMPELKHSMLGMLFIIIVGVWLSLIAALLISLGVNKIISTLYTSVDRKR
ncbi:MAG: hypothetical protein J0J06_03955 [Sphingomonas sp.]|uniref:hypothetical protein n=1 Tax=Sphingomonas sp. TaxID=28214 RepID=UPI001ACA777E|nr:hypothetical protein [Sphingomonas sp.]MBN8814585.1 hypothetical protein [Sphingomonas sp.]